MGRLDVSRVRAKIRVLDGLKMLGCGIDRYQTQHQDT
jgi:hypothetical protein